MDTCLARHCEGLACETIRLEPNLHSVPGYSIDTKSKKNVYSHFWMSEMPLHNFTKMELSVWFCYFNCCEVCEMKLQSLLIMVPVGMVVQLIHQAERALHSHMYATIAVSSFRQQSVVYMLLVYNSQQFSNKNGQQVINKSTQIS